MIVDHINIKSWQKRNKEKSIIANGKKIIIYTAENKSFSIVEEEKIIAFFKTLRT